MSIGDPLVLPPDVVIVAVEQLAAEVRARLPTGSEPFVVTRPSGRAPSKLVDTAAADLLRRFERPTTIVDAILAFGRETGLDPAALLEEAYPVLQDCFNARFLVPADSPEARQVMPMVTRGDTVAGYRIQRTIRVLGEVELHQLVAPDGGSAVLKLLRPDQPASARAQLAREADVLRRLDGRTAPAPAPAPRLLEQGDLHGEPWLIMDWCAGVSPVVAANAIRASASPAQNRELADLCRAILEAYVALHEAGVIHGDVHPNNVLIGRDGRATLVDFGAASDGTEPHPFRSWVAPYIDPSLAGAIVAQEPTPPCTMPDEQYCVAALLYYLLTGDHYLDFALDRETMLGRIVRDPPLPFSTRGVPPWRPVEAVLQRALEKEPAARYPSMAAFAEAFGRASAATPAGSGAVETSNPLPEAGALLRETKENIGPGGDPERLPLAGPTCSLSNGAAGLAYACYRLACLERDPELLAHADRWLSRAVRERDTAQAFEAGGYTPDTTGRRSPYHRESGLACVAALVSQAQGDHRRMRHAVREFMTQSAPPDAALDLTTGRTGTLQGAVLLLEMLPGDEREAREELLAFGHTTATAIWDRARSFGPVADGDQLTSTGMAHGWAGVLYGQLRWCQTTGSVVPPDLESRLDQLARLAEPTGRGVRWPWTVGQAGDGPRTMPGWCNGSAGFVHLWALAHRVVDRPAYLELACATGWDVCDDGSTVTSLCCGLTGRAYALLALYRHTGDIQWRDRALVLAQRAFARRVDVDHELAAQSLYKGVVGMALLAADLASPEGAAMPFFEAEGWPSHGA